MKAFLLRVVIAALCVALFLAIIPLFLEVVGLTVAGPMLALLRLCVAALALLYVLFGPAPPDPWA